MSRKSKGFLAALIALLGALFQFIAALLHLTARAIAWAARGLVALTAKIPSAHSGTVKVVKVTPPPANVLFQAPALAPVRQPTAFQAPRLSLVPSNRRVAPTLPDFEASSPMGLLSPQTPVAPRNDAALAETTKLLEATLTHFGVAGHVTSTSSGPTVATFEFEPAPGTRAAKAANGLDDDLSLALGRKVRVLLPVPGTTKLGFEIANSLQGKVALRDLLEDGRRPVGALTVALGRDMLGRPVYADLAKMPHVIVAGETGSGKSVAVNSMLLSLILSRSAAEVRLVLIDPKAVELTPYAKLPHTAELVTDMDLAPATLQRLIDEMERRFQLFASIGTKDIASYNKAFPQGALPRFVLVIDELADLVLSHKGVEKLIVRLAQKARAAGIHMILATQRPTVNVVTGLIKANCPTRIAFRVASATDSRVVLDEGGADNLLGRGDALVRLDGSLQRVQAPWVSEEEIMAVTNAFKSARRVA